MKTILETAIDMTEKAYDLADTDDGWAGSLLQSFLPLSSRGLIGVNYRAEDGSVEVGKVHVASGPAELAERKARLLANTPPVVLEGCTIPGNVATYSEITADFPDAMPIFQEVMQPMVDAIAINAVDPDGQGLVIIAGRERTGGITQSLRFRLQQMAVHFSAGHRLRREIVNELQSDLPLGGEAVLDPKNFRVEDAKASAQSANAAEQLREAAKQVDRARGSMRNTDPEGALELWQGLVDGRWSLIDWFDSDGRRYVIARPNMPNVGDPRGLTEREQQVATFAALGESSKLIGYRLGISKSTVSGLLASAKRKLGVKSQAQLVEKLRGLRGAYEQQPAEA